MKCPECRADVPDGATKCTACEAVLTPATGADAELVEIYRTDDVSLLPVIESVLMGEGIEFLVHGEEGQALFPLAEFAGPGKLGSSAAIRVREEDAERARAALETVASPEEEE